MATFNIFNPKIPAEEIVEVLAKHNTPINLINSVLETARGFTYQGTIVQSLRKDNKEAASELERPAVMFPETQIQEKVFSDNNVLGKIPTCELVKELEKREAVQLIWIEPYAPFSINKFGEAIDLEIAEGAAKILVVWD